MLDTINPPETSASPELGAGMVPEENATNGRRVVMRRAGFGLAGVAAAGLLASRSASAATTSTNIDVDIFNFSLNFEYLGAEYYLRAVTGQGLASYTSVTGTGVQGSVVGGTAVPFQTPAVAYFAQQLANDELGHVLFIREVLGSAAIAEPQIDLADAWTVLATSAGLIAPGQTFNPYDNEVDFLLGAYVLEDTCVTALAGAAALLTSPDNIAYAAGLLGAESYQAGLIRSYLSEVGGGLATNAISALRAKLSGVGDNGTDSEGNPYNFSNGDLNAQAFRRTTSQILTIAYGNSVSGTSSGLFFPAGVNGTIKSV